MHAQLLPPFRHLIELPQRLPIFSTYALCPAWCVKWTTLHGFPTKKPIWGSTTQERMKIMEPRESYILVTYWNWIRWAGVSTYQAYNQSWLQVHESRHHCPQSLPILLSHTTYGIRTPDPYGYWNSGWSQVSGRSLFQIPRQHSQLSHPKWSHRRLCIWNPHLGGKSQIPPEWFESRVKAVGWLLLVCDLLIFCYLTGLA